VIGAPIVCWCAKPNLTVIPNQAGFCDEINKRTFFHYEPISLTSCRGFIASNHWKFGNWSITDMEPFRSLSVNGMQRVKGGHRESTNGMP
jgi:hypothetical protein